MNNDKMIMKVQNEEGKEIECEVLFTFDSDETNKSYMAYTDNTTDEEGNIKVYASIYDKNAENPKLLPIETDKEWKIVEAILDELQAKIDSDDSAE